MDIEKIYNQLKEKIQSSNIIKDESMAKHTSFKIGGPVDIMVIPETFEELKSVVSVCIENQIPYYIIGNGSNLLVRDKGIRGVVIKVAENFSKVHIEGTRVTAQAGVLLSVLSKMIMREHLEGFEFASGIPGTLGGGLTMNAGAYGGEVKDVVVGASVLDEMGNVHYLDKEALELEYRSSMIQKKGYIVLEVDMELKKGDYQKIKETVDDLTQKRTSKQPLHLPSAGSTFKRPPGHFAGKLIEDAGLKGVRVGGAQVSDQHCGFVVNVGNATAEDVINLIKLIEKTVRDKFGVELHPEVKIIGEI
ncbi:MAG: UDP-N-acetylmuramate dehydrogenase [Bacillota bacterium]